MFDDENFQLPSPPHQSIHEHSPKDKKVGNNWGAQGTFMVKRGDFLPSLVDSVF